MQESPVIQWGKSFIDKFDLTSCKHVLDIGCRKGQLSEHLGSRYKNLKLIAIDNINQEVEQAKQYQLSNVQFETMDALKLDYQNTFDSIVSFSCLHWINNKCKVLQNIYRALKPGGKIYLQFFAQHGRQKNDRFLYQTAYLPRWKSYFKNFSPEYSEINTGELSFLLQNYGFIIHSISCVDYQSRFENSDILHHWFNSWASHKNKIPNRKRDQFLHEAVNAYMNHYFYDESESFLYNEYVFEIVCEKPLNNDQSVKDNYFRYGTFFLTPKEMSVLKYYLQGMSAKEISTLMSVSVKTIEFHISNIKNKLNCQRRSEIYQAAISYGFIHLIFHS